MSLSEKLDQLRAGSAERIPAETRAIMHQAVEDLRASRAGVKTLGVGDTAPAFELPNIHGEVVRSADLLAQGRLVVTFYRGFW